jgi:hypothetical protein
MAEGRKRRKISRQASDAQRIFMKGRSMSERPFFTPGTHTIWWYRTAQPRPPLARQRRRRPACRSRCRAGRHAGGGGGVAVDGFERGSAGGAGSGGRKLTILPRLPSFRHFSFKGIGGRAGCVGAAVGYAERSGLRCDIVVFTMRCFTCVQHDIDRRRAPLFANVMLTRGKHRSDGRRILRCGVAEYAMRCFTSVQHDIVDR